MWASVTWIVNKLGPIINSLAPGRSQCHFENVIFNLALLIGTFKSSYDNVLRWMPQNLTDDKLTLVQVMAWCRQATSHYLNQCWPRSPTPYGITRPQWVKNHGGVTLVNKLTMRLWEQSNSFDKVTYIRYFNFFSHIYNSFHLNLWNVALHWENCLYPCIPFH